MKTRSGPWSALLVLCLANFLILLDTSIVNTAAPDMMRSLDVGIDEILWVLNGYLIALAALLIVFGRLGDRVGPRAVFAGGLALFTATSVWCGAASDPAQLIAARVAQGVGAAALLPQALVLISGLFRPERRGAAFGIFTAVAGVAAVSGPTVGGLLVTEYGWRWIFFINVPIGLAGILLTFRFVPDLRTPRPSRFDLVGVLLATLGLVGVVYGLIEGGRHHWGRVAGPVSIPAILVASVALLVLFVLWEKRQTEPLVPMELFARRNFTVATLITLITSFALYGFLLVFVLQTQTLLGMSPFGSGVAALPWTLTLSAVAPLAGRLADRIGGRLLLCGGLAAYALGVLGVAFLPSRTSSAAVFVLPLVLIGIGMGSAIAPTTAEAMRATPPHRAGAASAVLNTARQVGAALGAAVVGAVLQDRLAASLRQAATDRAAQLPPSARGPFVDGFAAAADRGLQLGSGQHGGVRTPDGLPADLGGRFQQLVADTFGQAFLPAARPTLGVVAAVLFAGSLLALAVTRPIITMGESEVNEARKSAAVNE
ncbi:DHA2 family efflux MFS transporter permease subunit [Dactylosporangium sp. NPDC049140]|uniref:DHA2 family efflux MFS transporter permease subunit n=1 Tax=Dactylosporangium sp. NPDC049140 TaxID=3155647 RepID=UPI0034021906